MTHAFPPDCERQPIPQKNAASDFRGARNFGEKIVLIGPVLAEVILLALIVFLFFCVFVPFAVGRGGWRGGGRPFQQTKTT